MKTLETTTDVWNFKIAKDDVYRLFEASLWSEDEFLRFLKKVQKYSGGLDHLHLFEAM